VLFRSAMGKAVTTEFAFLVPSKTRNPWKSAHTPGGSSSGSAAAVACGMAPAAIGTQTNGSIIRPAAFCGVVGYKPGKGVLSTEGILPFSPTLDQPGVFARSVEDAALLVAHLAHSRWTISPQISALKHAPRLVAVRSPVWHLASEDQRNRFAMDVAGLREAGAVIEEIELPGSFNDAHKVHRTIMLYEAAAGSRAVREAYAAKFSEFLRKALEEGDRIGGTEYDRALKKREALERDFSRFLDEHAALPGQLESLGDRRTAAHRDEDVVGSATVRDLDDPLDGVRLARVNRVSRAEGSSAVALGILRVKRDDPGGAGESGSLDGVQPDADTRAVRNGHEPRVTGGRCGAPGGRPVRPSAWRSARRRPCPPGPGSGCRRRPARRGRP